MTKQLTHNGREVLLCEVPEGAECFEFVPTPDFGNYLDFSFSDGAAGNRQLPPGSWKLAFSSPLAPTESEAAEWVEDRHPHYGYRDYGESRFDLNGWLKRTALTSYQSWLRSLGFENPERVIPLVKQ